MKLTGPACSSDIVRRIDDRHGIDIDEHVVGLARLERSTP
jgi:hypothetical protein